MKDISTEDIGKKHFEIKSWAIKIFLSLNHKNYSCFVMWKVNRSMILITRCECMFENENLFDRFRQLLVN